MPSTCNSDAPVAHALQDGPTGDNLTANSVQEVALVQTPGPPSLASADASESDPVLAPAGAVPGSSSAAPGFLLCPQQGHVLSASSSYRLMTGTSQWPVTHQ